MKHIYFYLLMLIITPFLSTTVSAQCEGITADSLTPTGPYEVETITREDGIENGDFYRDATVYYPVGAEGQLPTIAIVPGFIEGAWAVADWGPFYASHGIVAVIIDTYTTLETPTFRAAALNEVLETMKLENVRRESPLYNSLDLTKLAVSGHSMGGGGAQIAANLNPEIKTVVALNPWHPIPGWFQNNSAVLIIAGGWDNIAPPIEHAFIHYGVTSNNMDKALVQYTFGTHFVGNSPKFNGGDVGKVALAWVKKFLVGDDCYCSVLKDDLLKPTFLQAIVDSNFTCNEEVLPNDPPTEPTLKVYPNPVTDVLYVDGFKNGDYALIDQNGQVMKTGTLTKNMNSINVYKLKKGIYYLQIDKTSEKIIVQ
ncbi:T9SS type A sorting domain-containing protein [Flavobacteriaceae bacterium Ap0902]|nr:T9SS type A sorting domain-containing protein [Flavobacteriaceae bacterium Ap0902]